MLLSPDRFCNALYAWCLSKISTEEDLSKFLYGLTEPPPDMKPTPEVIAAEMDSFAAFAGTFGVKAPTG